MVCPFHLPFPGNVAYACTNIQQVASLEEAKEEGEVEEGEEEEEEEKGTPHFDTWRNEGMWVNFFSGLH
jgi:hypothetical protein